MRFTQKKLSLSNTYSKLNNVLWEQKKDNCILQNENKILKSKIHFIQENLHKDTPQDCLQQKQQLKKLYEEIKNQQEWLSKTRIAVEQKNYQKMMKKKMKIQKNLTKSNKKAKQLIKRIDKLQKKLLKEQSQFNPLDSHQNKHNQLKQVDIPTQIVLQELQKQNQQLLQLLSYKQDKLQHSIQENNHLNKEVIQMLELKNFLRRLKMNQRRSSTPTKKITKEQESFNYQENKNSIKKLNNISSNKSYLINKVTINNSQINGKLVLKNR